MILNVHIKCSFSSSVSSVSVSSGELSIGSGIDTLLRVLIFGFPCKCFNTVSLQLIGIQGLNCLSLAIKVSDSSDVVVSSSVVQSVEAELELVDGSSLVVLLGVAEVAGMLWVSSSCCAVL